MSDELLVQGFENLQPDTSVNCQKGKDDPTLRLSDEILAFIQKSAIEAELKDNVCCFDDHGCSIVISLITNRLTEVGFPSSVHPPNRWTIQFL